MNKLSKKRTESGMNLEMDFQKSDEVPRYVHFRNKNQDAEHQICTNCSETKFCTNYVRTTKYRLLTIIPVNLFEQFRRKANFYFLIVACLSFLKISPKDPFINVAPLVIVLTVSFIKEAWEDYQRLKADRIVNKTLSNVYRMGHFIPVEWQNVVVGDVIRVFENQTFPSDCVLLQSSSPQGMCNIQTANFDGETNLKIRQGTAATYNIPCGADGSDYPINVSCILESDPPSAKTDSNSWKGNLVLPGYEDKIPLGWNQLLLRGCSLKNTAWVIALVVFTGEETKASLNSHSQYFKRSNVDYTVDKALYLIFALQATLCILGAVLNSVWLKANVETVWYLQYAVDNPNIDTTAAESFVTFLLLLDLLVPISLYVSMELVKVTQAWFINQDRDMYFEETDVPAVARTSNLNEELGQVHYVFSDKTGTLTRNRMDFLRCSIAGVSYGPGKMKEIGDFAHPYDRAKGIPPVIDYVFEDNRLQHHLLNGSPEQRQTIDEFLTLLVVCNTVIPEFPDCEYGCLDGNRQHARVGCPAEVEYQAASPDERALVLAAKDQQYYLHTRDAEVFEFGDGVRVEGQAVTVNIFGEHHKFDILTILEFSSTRKRMSVIVRDPRDDTIKLYCKGADNVIYERLCEQCKGELWMTNEAHLISFAHEGLRTLVCAYRTIPEYEYLEWLKQYQEAQVAMVDRKGRLENAAAQIERDLILTGSTAIEDKLQDGVPETISKLLEANIKVWVLTGDKLETAINVGIASKLLTDEMAREEFMIVDVDERMENEEALSKTLRYLEDCWKRVKNCPSGADNQALIISGRPLSYIFPTRERNESGKEIVPQAGQLEQETVLQLKLLRILLKCKACIFCRVSPKQKAEIVDLVRKNDPDTITLAIGDGANDVAMIQTANIGVGISGYEGLQATMASDYSIGQFRFLQPLLFVHGAWSYRRISLLILYSFYKNIAITITQVWFSIYSGYSGQPFFDPFTGSLFNLIFTAAPVVMTAFFNRDYAKSTALRYPKLYSSGQKNEIFTIRVLSIYLMEGFLHSLVLYLVAAWGLEISTRPDAQDNDLWVMSTGMFSACILVVSFKIAMLTKTWTKINHIFWWLSIGAYFAYLAVYSIWTTPVITPDMLGIANRLYGVFSSWMIIIISVAICILPDVTYSYVRRSYFPEPIHIAEELERGYGEFPVEEEEAKDHISDIDESVVVSVPLNKPHLRSHSRDDERRSSLGYAPFAGDHLTAESSVSQADYTRNVSDRNAQRRRSRARTLSNQIRRESMSESLHGR